VSDAHRGAWARRGRVRNDVEARCGCAGNDLTMTRTTADRRCHRGLDDGIVPAVIGLTRVVEGMQGTMLRHAASRLGRLRRVARLTVACPDGEVSRLDTNNTMVAAIFWRDPSKKEKAAQVGILQKRR
jgi:hypothetical protein